MAQILEPAEVEQMLSLIEKAAGLKIIVPSPATPKENVGMAWISELYCAASLAHAKITKDGNDFKNSRCTAPGWKPPPRAWDIV